jgi:hypothetical protein
MINIAIPLILKAFHCNSLPNQVEYNSEYMSPMQNSINKLSEQLDDIQKLMNAQNGITRQVGQLLSEVHCLMNILH